MLKTFTLWLESRGVLGDLVASRGLPCLPVASRGLPWLLASEPVLGSYGFDFVKGRLGTLPWHPVTSRGLPWAFRSLAPS